MSASEVLRHHQSRGNAERHIGEGTGTEKPHRGVGNVVKTARQWWLKLAIPGPKVRRIQRIEGRIEGLPPPEG